MPRPSLAAIAATFGLLVLATGCGKSAGNQTAPTPVLAVTSVFPNNGLDGTAVTIRGTGFAPGAVVRVGRAAAGVVWLSPDAITAVVHGDELGEQVGLVDVVVSNPSGERVTLTGGFRFTVVEQVVATLTVNKTVVTPGGELSVTWEASGTRSTWDWIALFRSAGSNATYEEGWWQYTGGTNSGTATLTAPTVAGLYEFRYLLDDGFVDVARSSQVRVE